MITKGTQSQHITVLEWLHTRYGGYIKAFTTKLALLHRPQPLKTSSFNPTSVAKIPINNHLRRCSNNTSDSIALFSSSLDIFCKNRRNKRILFSLIVDRKFYHVNIETDFTFEVNFVQKQKFSNGWNHLCHNRSFDKYRTKVIFSSRYFAVREHLHKFETFVKLENLKTSSNKRDFTGILWSNELKRLLLCLNKHNQARSLFSIIHIHTIKQW